MTESGWDGVVGNKRQDKQRMEEVALELSSEG